MHGRVLLVKLLYQSVQLLREEVSMIYVLVNEIESLCHPHGPVLEHNQALGYGQNGEYRATKPLNGYNCFLALPPAPSFEGETGRFVLVFGRELIDVEHSQNIGPAICQFNL